MHAAPTPAWPVIEHRCDIVDEGGGEQRYDYLVYDFGDDMIARAYLDDMRRVALMRGDPASNAVMTYLQQRFVQIDRLGARGYETIWTDD